MKWREREKNKERARDRLRQRNRRRERESEIEQKTDVRAENIAATFDLLSRYHCDKLDMMTTLMYSTIRTLLSKTASYHLVQSFNTT